MSYSGILTPLLRPQWRQFSFWSCTPASASLPAAEWIHEPALASCVHANPLIGPDGLVLVADLEGRLSWVNERWQLEKSWRCYGDGRVHLVESRDWDPVQGRAIVVTVGVSPFLALNLVAGHGALKYRPRRRNRRACFRSSRSGSSRCRPHPQQQQRRRPWMQQPLRRRT